jgi:DNA-binding NarL/FixJ family response regulator
MPPANEDIRVLIADDHRTFAEALKTVIDLERGIAVTEIVTDGRAAIESVGAQRPDIVLLDIQMPEVDGIAAIREIVQRYPEARVIVLSGSDDDSLLARAFDAGAAGFLSKTQPVADVAAAVRAVYRGERLMSAEEMESLRERVAGHGQDAEIRSRIERLTPRQVEILQLMADGLAPGDIADRLGISRHTLRTHVQNILTKLGVHSKLQALAHAIRYGKVQAR